MEIMGGYDANRKKVYKLLKTNGLTENEDFRSFLLDPCNSIFLQSYLIICSGYLPMKQVEAKLKDILSEIKFIQLGNYTFRKLFTMDEEWCEFFKENAYPHPSGQRVDGEARRGVDKEYVDSIMALKIGPPARTMDDAILELCLRKAAETFR